MIVLITGASHTGKTLLVQRILEKYGWPYLSLGHLKMGLIRREDRGRFSVFEGRKAKDRGRFSVFEGRQAGRQGTVLCL